MCNPSSLLVGFEPTKLKALIDVLHQDVNHAASSGAPLIVPSELASNRLKGINIAGPITTPYIPLLHQPSALVTYPLEAKCGGVTKAICKASHSNLKEMLRRAPSAVEQLRVIEQMKDENRFFKRLWDKAVSGSGADFISINSICNPCGMIYKHKIRTLLFCFKVRCRGDMARFLGVHGDRVVDGKIIMEGFTRVCQHAEVDDVALP
jgi:hypothetical protein